MSRTREVLKREVLERFDITITDEQIDSGMEFKEVGVDSLDSIELMVAIEDELDIELDERRLEDDIHNMKDLADYLAEFD